MTRGLLVCGLAAVAAAAPRAAAQQSSVSAFTVAGIPVIWKPITANEVIAVQLYLKGGSANLTPRTAGIERFIGAAGPLGTTRYTKDQFSALATATGAEFNTDAGEDFTVFSVRGAQAHWGETWDLFTQAVLHPLFPESELPVARDQLLNGLRQRQDDADQYLAMLSDSVLFAGHPYAIDPEGTVASIGALTRADLAAWHRTRMTKENLLLVVVGNVSRADLEAKVAAAFGTLPARGGRWVAAPALTGPAKGSVTVVARALPTNYVQGVFPTPNPGDSDFAAVRVATDLLSDRLFEEVRTKRNLTYAVYAGLDGARVNHGLLYVTAVDPDTTVKVMLNEVRRLQNEAITVTQIGANVNTYLTNYFLRQEANMSQATTLGSYELVGGGWARGESFINRLRAVTAADIQRAARSYFKNFAFVVIGDTTKVDPKLFTSM